MTSIKALPSFPEILSRESTVADYIALLKPRVMSLVIFTALCGLLAALNMPHPPLHPFLGFMAIASIALGSGAAGALNMWYERDIDALMTRTRDRPIPAGRITAEDAFVFGMVLSVISVITLGLAVHWKAALLLAFTIFFYVVVYTMLLKRTTPQNIVVGGVAGALPPVIGWLAVTGSLSPEPIIMFLIIFWWTVPHFWALCLCIQEDYAQANLPMMPLVRGIQSTKRQIVGYAFLLVITSMVPYFMGIYGSLYGGGSALLGTGFLIRSFQVLNTDDKKIYGKLFGYSIVYLFILFSLMLISRA